MNMCGIAGICNLDAEWQNEIRKMNHVLKNRGPDGEGIWNDCGYIALGHRRLSIFDLSTAGAQPMISQSRRWVICFNGEIYNFKEILQKLRDEGNDFQLKGQSDTEVLLEAFDIWGVSRTINKIRGMYAIALYDLVDKKLYLIRDRVGEKPLYYGFVKGQFTFASDLRAILAREGVNKDIDVDAVKLFLKKHYIPGPHSILKEFKKLLPGQMLSIQYPFKEFQLETYYSLEKVALEQRCGLFQGNLDEASDILEDRLCKVISEQLCADVPVGILLSGGIDSSLVTSLAQRQSLTGVSTYTVGFENSSIDETEYSRKIANHLGTRHHEIYLSDQNLMDAVFKVPYVFSEPFANYSGVPSIVISEYAKKNVTVILGGDGGDELFAGYTQYAYAEKWWNIVSRTPGFIKAVMKIVDDSQIIKNPIWIRNLRYFQATTCFEFIRRMDDIYTQDNFLKLDNRVDSVYMDQEIFMAEMVNQALLVDQKGCLVDCSCVRADMTGMAVGLEIRSPLLDKEILELSWRLPQTYKLYNGVSKRILRKILYKYVPRELIERPKQPFWMPVEEWLKQGKMREWASDMLSASNLRKLDLFNIDHVQGAWSKYTNQNIYDARIWGVLMLQLWCDANGVQG